MDCVKASISSFDIYSVCLSSSFVVMPASAWSVNLSSRLSIPLPKNQSFSMISMTSWIFLEALIVVPRAIIWRKEDVNPYGSNETPSQPKRTATIVTTTMILFSFLFFAFSALSFASSGHTYFFKEIVLNSSFSSVLFSSIKVPLYI